MGAALQRAVVLAGQLAGRASELAAAELAREVALIGEAAAQRDLGQRAVTVDQGRGWRCAA